jgi:hypothetical protein
MLVVEPKIVGMRRKQQLQARVPASLPAQPERRRVRPAAAVETPAETNMIVAVAQMGGAREILALWGGLSGWGGRTKEEKGGLMMSFRVYCGNDSWESFTTRILRVASGGGGEYDFDFETTVPVTVSASLVEYVQKQRGERRRARGSARATLTNASEGSAKGVLGLGERKRRAWARRAQKTCLRLCASYPD